MKRFSSLAILFAAVMLVGAPALAGVQTTTCTDLGGGVWYYTFFACAPNVNANDLHINLLASEIGQGESVVGCSVPALPGYSCSFTPTGASYFFPTIGPFDCVPNLPGDVNKFDIEIMSADGISLVEEIWTLDGVPVAGFISVITCPPVAVEDNTWGQIKTLYR